MNVETKLARVFRTVGEQEQQMESTASAVLSIVKDAKALSLKKFDKLVRAAYAENGWNARSGRPAKGGEPKLAVPGTVRTYVTVIRQALRQHMKVGKYKTFSALRSALGRKSSTGLRRVNGRRNGSNILRLPAPVAMNFVGVDIEDKKPNGALFHDLGLVYAKLPAEHQPLFERQVKRLMAKYAPLVPGALGEELRKAA